MGNNDIVSDFARDAVDVRTETKGFADDSVH